MQLVNRVPKAKRRQLPPSLCPSCIRGKSVLTNTIAAWKRKQKVVEKGKVRGLRVISIREKAHKAKNHFSIKKAHTEARIDHANPMRMECWEFFSGAITPQLSRLNSSKIVTKKSQSRDRMHASIYGPMLLLNPRRTQSIVQVVVPRMWN